MITASHNPPEYNGIKLFNRDSSAFNEEQQNQIKKIINKKFFKRAPWQNVKDPITQDCSKQYLKMLQKAVKLKKNWRVVLDPGCGATCYLVPIIFQKLGCEVTIINSQPDGFFPGRNPLPTSKSLQNLSCMVKTSNADLGIAYDGDGDRMVVVDENGVLSPLDQILAAFASHVIKKRKGGIVVTNMEASMCVEKEVEAFGGKVVRTRVGDVYIIEAMKQNKSVFGGEPSGAWINPQHHFCPDGILSSLLLLQSLEEATKSLSLFISEIPRYPIIRRDLVCPEKFKVIVMNNLKDSLPVIFNRKKETITLDGIRLILRDGWILIRPSGTEPLIRLTVEAESMEKAKQTMNKATKLVKKIIMENY
jgi:phosphoglucosamine mutase